MANTIKLKNSAVAAKTPLLTDLAYGEVALNYADGKIYYKRSDNTIQSISGGGGSSIVVSDEGTSLTTALTSLNFTGSGVTATNTSGAVTVTIPGGGGSSSTWTKITSATTAGTGQQFLATSTVGTLTLPPSPTTGNSVLVMDGGNWSVTNLIIARNGSTIANAASDLVCDIGGSLLTLVYDGSTWNVTANVGAQGATGPAGANGSGAVDRKSYIATASQTVFAIKYTAPYVDVFLNGVRLSSSDYTATSGSSITMAVGAIVGDEVELMGFGTTSGADPLSPFLLMGA